MIAGSWKLLPSLARHLGPKPRKIQATVFLARGSQLLSVVKFNSANLPGIPSRHLAQFEAEVVQEASSSLDCTKKLNSRWQA